MLPKRSKSCYKVAKSSNVYFCEICDYTTSRKNNYDKHILTIKHLKKALKSVDNPLLRQKKSSNVYICELCECEYKDRSGLWRHKKKCIVESESESEEEEEKKPANNGGVFFTHEQLKMLLTQKTMGDHNTNCMNTNNNITVQVYLDEHCKDAKSIESIKTHILKGLSLGLKDIVYPSNSQLIKDAPSDLYVNMIKKMPAEERPVHCSDGKRGKFWVKKEEDGWVQEDVNIGGELKETISLFKGKILAKGRGEIFDKGYERPSGLTQQELELSGKLGDKYNYKNKAIDNAIIAKLATNCNIKDAIKDIEDKD